MKKLTTLFFTPLTAICLLMMVSCKKTKEDVLPPDTPLVGNPGNPRFNLQFTNEANVDLDLYVQTPNGTKIYYSNQTAQGGELDVDCLCGDCPNGPNENIFWVDGTAPAGAYKFWVEYYDDCGNSGSQASTYTLRLLRNSQILETYTGTLTPTNRTSPKYTFTK